MPLLVDIVGPVSSGRHFAGLVCFVTRSHCVGSKFYNPLPLPSKCSNYRYVLPCAALEDMFYVLFYFICICPLNNNVSFVSSYSEYQSIECQISHFLLNYIKQKLVKIREFF